MQRYETKVRLNPSDRKVGFDVFCLRVGETTAKRVVAVISDDDAMVPCKTAAMRNDRFLE